MCKAYHGDSDERGKSRVEVWRVCSRSHRLLCVTDAPGNNNSLSPRDPSSHRPRSRLVLSTMKHSFRKWYHCASSLHTMGVSIIDEIFYNWAPFSGDVVSLAEPSVLCGPSEVIVPKSQKKLCLNLGCWTWLFQFNCSFWDILTISCTKELVSRSSDVEVHKSCWLLGGMRQNNNQTSVCPLKTSKGKDPLVVGCCRTSLGYRCQKHDNSNWNPEEKPSLKLDGYLGEATWA